MAITTRSAAREAGEVPAPPPEPAPPKPTKRKAVKKNADPPVEDSGGEKETAVPRRKRSRPPKQKPPRDLAGGNSQVDVNETADPPAPPPPTSPKGTGGSDGAQDTKRPKSPSPATTPPATPPRVPPPSQTVRSFLLPKDVRPVPKQNELEAGTSSGTMQPAPQAERKIVDEPISRGIADFRSLFGQSTSTFANYPNSGVPSTHLHPFASPAGAPRSMFGGLASPHRSFIPPKAVEDGEPRPFSKLVSFGAPASPPRSFIPPKAVDDGEPRPFSKLVGTDARALSDTNRHGTGDMHPRLDLASLRPRATLGPAPEDLDDVDSMDEGACPSSPLHRDASPAPADEAGRPSPLLHRGATPAPAPGSLRAASLASSGGRRRGSSSSRSSSSRSSASRSPSQQQSDAEEDDGDQEEEKLDEEKDEQAVARESSGNESDDDYESTTTKATRQFDRDRLTFSSMRDLRTVEEEDSDFERDFEKDTAERRAGGGKKGGKKDQGVPKKRKRQSHIDSDDDAAGEATVEKGGKTQKRKLKKPQVQPAAAAAGDATADEDDGEGPHKPGPIDQKSLDLLFRWKEEFEQKVEGLALTIKKPKSLLWSLVDTSSKSTRKKSGWNAFQCWLYAAEDAGGGGQVPDPQLTKKEQGQHDRDALLKRLPSSVSPDDATKTEMIFKHLTWLERWNDELEAQVLKDRQQNGGGGLARGIALIGKDLAKLSDRAYKEFELHVLGHIISPVYGGSKSFGATAAAKLYKQHHGGVKKVKELESQIHVFQMEVDGVAAAEILKFQQNSLMKFPSLLPRGTTARELRDAGRGFIKDRLVDDIVEIRLERGELSPEDVPAATTKTQMKWTSWADHAFEHKLRMENWDEAMAAAEQIPKKGFAMTTFSSEVLKRMLPPLEARFRVPNSDEADEEDSNTDAEDAGVDPEDSIRIVSWSEVEMALPLEKQGGVPVLTTLRGTVMLKASHAVKFVAEGRKQKAKQAKAMEREERGRKRRRSSSPSRRRAAESPSPATRGRRRRSDSPAAARGRRASDSLSAAGRDHRGHGRPRSRAGRERGTARRPSPSPVRDHERRHSGTARENTADRARRPPQAPAAKRRPSRDGADGPSTTKKPRLESPPPISKAEKKRLKEVAAKMMQEDDDEGLDRLALIRQEGPQGKRVRSDSFRARLRTDGRGKAAPRELYFAVPSKKGGDEPGWKPVKASTVQFLHREELEIYEDWVARWEILI